MEGCENVDIKPSLVPEIKCEPTPDLGDDDGFEFEYVMVKQEAGQSESPTEVPEDGNSEPAPLEEPKLRRPSFRVSICRFCNMAFPNGDSCVEHIIVAHPTELPFQCRICRKRFKTARLRDSHEDIHNPNRYAGPPQFKCDMCDNEYHFQSSLISHRKKIHFGFPYPKCRKPTEASFIQSSRKGVRNPKLVAKRRTFPCGTCSRKFQKQSLLEKHEIIHTDATPFQCESCPRAFNTEKSLGLHFRQTHIQGFSKKQASEDLSCSNCDLHFRTLLDFKNHMHQVHNESPFKCDICSKVYENGQKLRLHRERRHFRDNSGLRNYHCRICGDFETLRWSTLRAHLQRFHRYSVKKSEDNGIYRYFACGVCEKPYSFGISAIICALTRHGGKEKKRKAFELRWGIGIPKEVEESEVPLYKKLELWPHFHRDVKKKYLRVSKTDLHLKEEDEEEDDEEKPTDGFSGIDVEEATSVIEKMIAAKTNEIEEHTADARKKLELNNKFLAATLSCFKGNGRIANKGIAGQKQV